MRKIQTTSEFAEFAHRTLTVFLFSAPWCKPCSKIKPAIDAMIEDFPHVTFAEVDVDVVPTLAQNYCVKSVPTVFVFRNGVLCIEKTSNITARSVRRLVEGL